MNDIQINAPLRDFNTLRLESWAAFFASAGTREDVQNIVHTAISRDLPLNVLGGGSNALLRRDIDGLTIHMNILGRQLVDEDVHHAVIRLGAGEVWHDVVLWAHSQGYHGLENLALIPGSVGAAPVQNIGAYGVEIEQFIERIEVVHALSGDITTLTNSECGFGYRDSVFKRAEGKHLLITSVDLRLSKKPICCLDYPGLRNAISADPVTPHHVLDAVVAIRTRKLPDPNKEPNVGSFFKNPIVSESVAARLKDKYVGMPQFATEHSQTKLSAAWMIDYMGWRGVEECGVVVSDRHALVLINRSAKFASQVIDLASKIQSSVQAEFGVQLEIEPQILGLDR